MGRDHQFEIQYLISLTVAVLGIISADQIKPFINQWIGFGFLLLISIHFVLFNVYYTFGEAIDVDINWIAWLRRETRWIWGAITAGFLFFVLHTVSALFFVYFSYCGTESPVFVFPVPFSASCEMGKILILYGLPMVTVGAMGIPYRRKIQSPLQTLRDLNIKIAPTELKIFSVFQESEPLFVKVENQGRDIHKYTLRVDLPEEVIAKYDGQEFADEIVNEGEVKPEGRPDSAARYNIRLKYSGNEIRSGLIEVQIEHSAGSVEKDVETLLVPQ